MVYCDQDMCESKLGRLMQAFRADRPSEWQMDEFIGMAEKMHKEIERLRQAEKDAARYRWLKNQPWFECEAEWCMPVNMNAVGYDFFASIDGVIDEDMQCSK